MKYDHEIIRDLMPLCIDGIASRKSEEAVRTHIVECPECAEEWKEMNKGIENIDKEKLPESTAKYVDTAKRVRKKGRLNWLISVLVILVGVPFVMVIGNWVIGNRYSSDLLAKSSSRHDWKSTPDDSWFLETYGIEEKCKASKLKFTVNGAITAPDNKNRVTFVTAEIPDSDLIACWINDQSREYPLHMGMWEEKGGSGGSFAKSESIIMAPSAIHYDMGEGIMDYWIFYSQDKNVAYLEVNAFGEKDIVPISQKGFGYVTREMTVSDKIRMQMSPDEITEGEAFDSNGKLLYKVVPVETEQDGETYINYEWIKAE